MLRALFIYLKGYLKIRLTGYSPERFLNLCKNKKIEIWNLEYNAQGYEMLVFAKDFKKLKPLLRKTKTKVIIVERIGFPFVLHKYRKRRCFLVGCIICIGMIFALSRQVWKIEVVGNSAITDQTFYEYLETQQIYCGISKKKIDCKQIGTEIRMQFPDVIWVSVSLEGSNLKIHVKENTDSIAVLTAEEEGQDLVASFDGIITSIITRKGTPCVNPGTEVKAGDVLVAGKIEVKDDAGEVVRENICEADADIWAETTITYEDEVPKQYLVKKYKKRTLWNLYVKLGKYYAGTHFFLKQSNQEIRTTEHNLTKQSYFKLPIQVGISKLQSYEWENCVRSESEMQAILNQNWEQYFKKVSKEQTEILDQDFTYQKTRGGMKLKGTVKIRCSIGKPVKRIDL